jgi:hypothetical protein
MDLGSQKINYKHVLHDLNIDDFKSKPPDCTCASSPFIYNPTGHVITGDIKIINNISLRETRDVTHKYNIVRGLVGGDNNIFVMEERQVFANIWVFKN